MHGTLPPSKVLTVGEVRHDGDDGDDDDDDANDMVDYPVLQLRLVEHHRERGHRVRHRHGDDDKLGGCGDIDGAGDRGKLCGAVWPVWGHGVVWVDVLCVGHMQSRELVLLSVSVSARDAVYWSGGFLAVGRSCLPVSGWAVGEGAS